MENRTEYLLEAYFAHTLAPEEAEELRWLLQSDEELATEMRFRQQIAHAARDKSLHSGIKNQDWASAALPSFSGGSALRRDIWSRFLYAAAAVLALLVVAWLYLPGKDTGDIIAANTAFYPNKMTFKSLGREDLTVPREVIQAFSLYDQQRFPEAADAFQALVTDYPDNVDYRFYWGVSLTHLRQYGKAITALEPIGQSENDYKTVARYYLGLAYAGNQEMDKAKTSLKQYLDAPDGVTYRKQATKVMNNLD
jgi:tetratricopeptide (TPR) repeat protein